MIRSHQNSLRLVETLLDVYRNETEGLQLRLAPINLATLAEDVATSLLPISNSRSVYWTGHYGDSEFRKFLRVNGDAFQLRRGFSNLFTNAINHSPRWSKVEVVLETESSYQLVQVLDFGAGIKPEEKQYLFERFYQGQSDRLATGSGLGLYLTRQIIEAHKGTIWAENRQTQGATFTTLKNPLSNLNQCPLDNRKILLVEDDQLFRLGLQVRLQQETKITVLVEASDGEMALDLAKEQTFDLVLLDIGLPGIGGLETCRQLKLNHPNLPILVLTSRNEHAFGLRRRTGLLPQRSHC